MTTTTQPWLTTSQFAAYWRDHDVGHRGLWVLTDERAHESDDGTALVGVYASPLDMLALLAFDYLGPEHTARLTWRRAESHDGYWDAYGQRDDGTEDFYLLYAATVESSYGAAPTALAQAIRLSPPSDPYPP